LALIPPAKRFHAPTCAQRQVLRQSQTAISAQIGGAAGMRVGRRRAPPLPEGHLSIAANGQRIVRT
jgi:hypothetical protein